jgi:hypothetical protein
MPKLVEFRHLPELQNQSRTISSLLLHSFHLEIQITKMITLPVELQRLCLKPLHRNVDALKAVRLVNRHLNVLTTELLFRTVVLNHTEKSASRFVGILNSSLEHVVRHVIINTSEDPRGHYEQESEIEMPFAEAISILHKFSHLEGVSLKFSEECTEGDYEIYVAETMDFREEILNLMFAALQEAKSVTELTIKNMQDYQRACVLESKDFAIVRDRLTKLHLHITMEQIDASPAGDIDLGGRHTCFNDNLPKYWLSPTSNKLTHLTLYGNDYWGVYPFIDLREIPTFSHLKYLNLGNFTIIHSWQVDWVVAHSGTLEELILHECAIVVALSIDDDQAQANYPNQTLPEDTRNSHHSFVQVSFRWHEVLDRFRLELPRLKHFVLSNDETFLDKAFEKRNDLVSKVDDSRYLTFDYGMGPTSWLYPEEMRRRGDRDEDDDDEEDIDPFRTLEFDGRDERALADLSDAIGRRESTKM